MRDKDSNIPSSGTLPTGYEEVLYWSIQENLKQAILLQIFSLPLAILSALVFFGLAFRLGNLPSSLGFGSGGIGVVITAILLTIILHELTHGIVMRRFGAQPRYGVLWKQGAFYATAPGFAFRRNDYIQIALAPVFVLSGLVILGIGLSSGTFWAAAFALAGIINAGGSIGDLWMTAIVLRYPVEAHVVDEKDGIRVFLQKH